MGARAQKMRFKRGIIPCPVGLEVRPVAKDGTNRGGRRVHAGGKPTPAAEKMLQKLTALRFGNLPVCIAKTQYSLSDDQYKLGRPTGFTVNVRDVYVSAGAGFVVVLTGAIMTMPGLSKSPAAYGIDVNEDGKITGLF